MDKDAVNKENLPRVFMLEPQNLIGIKKRILSGDPVLNSAWRDLTKQAEKAINQGVFSVVQKKKLAPSGDKHDYMSMGPYWWPNPDTPDGLPYINKDGQVNPECRGSDRTSLKKLIENVETLALACFYLDDIPYGEFAGKLLKTWFINPETRMNPHLEYSQGIPGHCEGRGTGIIDTMNMHCLLDAVGLLDYMGVWEEDQIELKKWFEELLYWLQYSKKGIEEYNATSNHGTWYDVQVCSIALFIGKNEVAKKYLSESFSLRVEKQIEPDGSQPQELKRTRSFHYSLMNLRGLFCLARLGEHLGLDIWNFCSKDGKLLRKAVDFMLPYILDYSTWPYNNINKPSEIQWIMAYLLLMNAADVFGDKNYARAAGEIPLSDAESNRVKLLYV
jgi:hypothetical protein